MRIDWQRQIKRAATLFLLLASAALLATGASVRPAQQDQWAPAADSAVRGLLRDQAAAWNRGDVDGFLAGYRNSGQTIFAGSQGIIRGWEQLRQRYHTYYPDRQAMGTLTFSSVEVTFLCPDAALAVGNWHLDRDAGPVGGVFSLVLRQYPEGWRIIADHTSVVPEAAPARQN